MNWIVRLALMLAGHHLKLRLLNQVKKMGTLAYLRALRGSRRVLMSGLAAFLLLQIMVLAGFGVLVTGFYLWDRDPQFKLQVLFGIFLALLALPAALIVVLFSERFWYRASGAQDLVEKVNRDRDAA